MLLFYMYFLFIIAAVWIWRYYHSSNPTNELPTQKSNTIIDQEMNQEMPIHTWIDDWIAARKHKSDRSEHEYAIFYHLSMVLKTCTADLHIRYLKGNQSVHMAIVFPVIIDDRYFPRMNTLMNDFNACDHPYLLTMDKNNGTLHLGIEVDGDHINTLENEGKTDLIYNLFLRADGVFAETMSVIYGNTLPEIAAMKLTGQRSIQLN
jgi:hypothetical protein